MSCRHQSDSPPTPSFREAPCSTRKWRRRTCTPPAACNDNEGGAWVRARAIFAAVLGGLLFIGAALGVLDL
ncbi:hypothetical protein C0214_09330 [Methylobacterium sp. DM1]|nr:hypothetical protein C0214_09330 [Methylobacterium sp. DM1]